MGRLTETPDLRKPENASVGPFGLMAEAYAARSLRVFPTGGPDGNTSVAIDILGVTDPEGQEVSINIDAIRQDEAVRGRGSGNTGMDGRGVGTSTAEVRAEASGRLNGRVYHISFTATDATGNSCSSVVNVGVPHDMGVNGPAVDDGPTFDSTTN